MSAKIIAMWSGPRNLSTAMMRSFAQRADCKVWDEPFYAAYLLRTGLDHPMRDEIIAAGVSEYSDVEAACLKLPEAPKSLFYQKHMTHHMVEGVDLSWTDKVTNVFLIREPERVLASYAKKRGTVVAEDLGYRMQAELFARQAERSDSTPVVIDSYDIRLAPENALRKLCKAVGIEFAETMLSWPKGESPDDGVWASHWYDAIWKSTGFAPPEKQLPAVPEDLRSICDEVRADYEFLSAHKLKIDPV